MIGTFFALATLNAKIRSRLYGREADGKPSQGIYSRLEAAM